MKTKTLKALDTDITAVQSDIQTLEFKAVELTNEIAENYNADTTEQETLYARLQARLIGARKRLTMLTSQHEETLIETQYNTLKKYGNDRTALYKQIEDINKQIEAIHETTIKPLEQDMLSIRGDIEEISRQYNQLLTEFINNGGNTTGLI